jgi:hypothetical protein
LPWSPWLPRRAAGSAYLGNIVVGWRFCLAAFQKVLVNKILDALLDERYVGIEAGRKEGDNLAN